MIGQGIADLKQLKHKRISTGPKEMFCTHQVTTWPNLGPSESIQVSPIASHQGHSRADSEIRPSRAKSAAHCLLVGYSAVQYSLGFLLKALLVLKVLKGKAQCLLVTAQFSIYRQYRLQ